VVDGDVPYQLGGVVCLSLAEICQEAIDRRIAKPVRVAASFAVSDK